MKKFNFRLERVLQYRTLIKEEKKRLLMIKNGELYAAREYLDELEHAQLNNLIAEGTVMSANQVFLVSEFGNRIREAVINQKLEILRIEGEVEQAIQEYVEAAKDARALELLKEKKKEEYKEYVNKEEGKFLDELSIQRARVIQEQYQ